MKNKDLILMLINKSTNAFGELIGLTEEAKLKVALSIIQDTSITALGIDPNLLCPKSLADILVKDQLDWDQTRLLTNLLWTQAEILLKLNQPIASLTNYENALHLLQWQTQETLKNDHLEKQNKITTLKAVIETLQLDSCTKNAR
ncbi:MAG: hypothetical protein Q8L90_01080 [Bacteroidota bacterium]|nr:hypothetical protein [Bacteroidota bacterium]